MNNCFGNVEKRPTKEDLKKRILAAGGKAKAEIVIKNGRVIDVFSGEIIMADVAITDGIFVGIGEYEGDMIIDAEGRYISPALIDGHVHIESSMVSPSEFAKVILPHGVTTVIADPHEIANVAGVRGVEYMLKASEGIPLDVFIMLPSCVPATPFETSGARLEAEDLQGLYNHPRVLGLGEVMNYPAVLNTEEAMMEKLLEAKYRGGKIDGHAAGLDASGINVYMTASIRTDHEAVTQEEARERIRRGMYLMIREGTAAKDLESLIGIVTPQNSRRCIFVTDDKHLDDLVDQGSVDHNVRIAIGKGISPITAIQMASLNTAECFGLEYKGAIAPGYEADFMLLDNLHELKIYEVYKNGVLAAKEGKIEDSVFKLQREVYDEELLDSVCIGQFSKEDLKIMIKGKKAHVIGIIPNSLVTRDIITEVEVKDDEALPTIELDILKLVVIQRHNKDRSIGWGLVKGFGLKSGAIASTVVHDSHNLIVLGTNDNDMNLAIKEIERLKGGIVVVKDGIILAALPLKVGGLMSTTSWNKVLKGLKNINASAALLGASPDFNPFLTLSFLALPVIPELKITDRGLFDVSRFKHIALEADLMNQ